MVDSRDGRSAAWKFEVRDCFSFYFRVDTWIPYRSRRIRNPSLGESDVGSHYR